MLTLRRLIVGFVAAGGVLVAGSGMVAAQVPPGGGNAFGKHVSGMAPEHARSHGAEFGACVSAMARTGECPHHQPG